MIKARLIISLACGLVASLLATGSAMAHGSYPSEHRASALCYETTTNGQWAVMSNVYMNRADGYPRAVYGTSIGDGGYFTGGSWTLIESNTQQWLYYRVAIATQSSSGAWTWKYGNWMRRLDALGDHTSGLDTEVETFPGSGVYVQTGYTATSSPQDVSLVSGRIGVGPRLKQVYGQMWWGPIYNMKNQQVFAPYTHWEPLGSVSCG